MGQWSRRHLEDLICEQPTIKQTLLSVFITAIPVTSFAENRDETDRQINEALEQPQPASEIKL
ncbi:MAG: hypothetical protein ABJ364_07910 [Lentilitoribacter sp.]